VKVLSIAFASLFRVAALALLAAAPDASAQGHPSRPITVPPRTRTAMAVGTDLAI
jgi:hypothetical protein